MATKSNKSTKKTSRSKKTPKAAALPARPQKPAIQPATWITLLFLVIIIASYTFYHSKKVQEESQATATPASVQAILFNQDSSNVRSIEVKPADGETVKAARSADKTWALVLPFETEADQGIVEAAATQISALTIVDKLDAKLDILGLDKPVYVITIEFVDGTIHTLEVGDHSPSNSGYYVRVDKQETVILQLNEIDALTNLVSSPPYLNTPTPTALPPTPTVETPTETESTPDPAVTPTP